MYGYIYKIRNLVNGKVYIGQTTQSIKKREHDHFYELKTNIHANCHLQSSFNKYGKENFKFEVINWATNQEELNKQEVYFINKYQTLNDDFGYNFRAGGTNGIHHPETIKKMSQVKTGKKRPDFSRKWRGKKHWHYGKSPSLETRQKMSESQKGRVATTETRQKLRIANLGKKHSEKTKKKLSKIFSGDGNPKYWKGKEFSLEHRKKISESKKGTITTLEHRKKLSDRGAGRGQFGFTGAIFIRHCNPEMRCWRSNINFKGNTKFLGMFNDPLTAQLVYNLVKEELYN